MRNQNGWSLLELLIVITIAAVAGGLIVNILVSSSGIFFDQSTQISHNLSLNQSELELTQIIKSTPGIVSQYPVSGTPQFTTDGDTLIARLPAINESGNVIDSVYDYVVVEADPEKPEILRKQIFLDELSVRNEEDKVLSTNLSEIEFNYLDVNNNPVTPDQAVRVNFLINLSTNSNYTQKENSGGGTVNIKNL